MSNVTQFPININYRIYGIHRDGRIIVQVLNSPKRFLMYAEKIISDQRLIRNFSKKQVQWLCDISALDANNYQQQRI